MSVIKMTDHGSCWETCIYPCGSERTSKDGKVTSDARIRASLPTIELALKQGAK